MFHLINKLRKKMCGSSRLIMLVLERLKALVGLSEYEANCD